MINTLLSIISLYLINSLSVENPNIDDNEDFFFPKCAKDTEMGK